MIETEKQHILVIDDDPVIIMSLELVLMKKGYKVFKSSDPKNCTSVIGKEQIDLVILDFYMANTRGIDILKTIRLDEKFSNVPVILLTSEESPDIIEECLDAGATDFIIKPIIPKVLLARIRSAILNRENIIQIEKQKEEILGSKQKLSEVLYHLEKDIKKARVTQTTLIPTKFIESNLYKIYSYYQPMIEVGGDFFSHFENSEKTDILFGDVSGHGISSAMVSCMAVLCFQTMPHDKLLIEHELEYLHNTLLQYVTGHYLTGVYLRFDPKKFLLEYAFAGHHEIVLIRNGEFSLLTAKGTPIILMKDFLSSSYSIPLEKGDRLFLFSDGLFEIFNKNNEFYGMDNFLSDAKKFSHLHGSDFLKEVSNSSILYSGNVVKDDMTMLLIEF